MFVGREKELQILNRLYESDSFEFLAMYGRRRVGKTELLTEFSKNKNVIFYPALDQTTNLSRFTSFILAHFNERLNLEFKTWESAFSYISKKLNGEKALIIIDEYPYIVKNEPEVQSHLQTVIDSDWKDKNIKLILCGSSVSFMLNEVLSEKKPLYGRNTAVMEVVPFDYGMTAEFLPIYSKEELMIVYSILGGVPYYLSKFSSKKSLKQNLADAIFAPSSPLREEVTSLLKAELRDVATYNSILSSIANGAATMSEIADKSKIEVTSLPPYISALIEMRVVKKILPCGERATSKKGRYIISDNFFSFWYRYVYDGGAKLIFMDPIDYVEDIYQDILRHIGYKFEGICYQYLKNHAKTLPFIPRYIGKWWGSNPYTKAPDEIDILGMDGDKYLFCECKFRNVKFDLKEFNDLLLSSMAFQDTKEKYFYIFTKSGFTDAVIEESKKYNCKLITIEDM